MSPSFDSTIWSGVSFCFVEFPFEYFWLLFGLLFLSRSHKIDKLLITLSNSLCYILVIVTRQMQTHKLNDTAAAYATGPIDMMSHRCFVNGKWRLRWCVSKTIVDQEMHRRRRIEPVGERNLWVISLLFLLSFFFVFLFYHFHCFLLISFVPFPSAVVAFRFISIRKFHSTSAEDEISFFALQFNDNNERNSEMETEREKKNA